jgi:hypothetical protein
VSGSLAWSPSSSSRVLDCPRAPTSDISTSGLSSVRYWSVVASCEVSEGRRSSAGAFKSLTCFDVGLAEEALGFLLLDGVDLWVDEVVRTDRTEAAGEGGLRGKAFSSDDDSSEEEGVSSN